MASKRNVRAATMVDETDDDYDESGDECDADHIIFEDDLRGGTEVSGITHENSRESRNRGLSERDESYDESEDSDLERSDMVLPEEENGQDENRERKSAADDGNGDQKDENCNGNSQEGDHDDCSESSGDRKDVKPGKNEIEKRKDMNIVEEDESEGESKTAEGLDGLKIESKDDKNGDSKLEMKKKDDRKNENDSESKDESKKDRVKSPRRVKSPAKRKGKKRSKEKAVDEKTPVDKDDKKDEGRDHERNAVERKKEPECNSNESSSYRSISRMARSPTVFSKETTEKNVDPRLSRANLSALKPPPADVIEKWKEKSASLTSLADPQPKRQWMNFSPGAPSRGGARSAASQLGRQRTMERSKSNTQLVSACSMSRTNSISPRPLTRSQEGSIARSPRGLPDREPQFSGNDDDASTPASGRASSCSPSASDSSLLLGGASEGLSVSFSERAKSTGEVELVPESSISSDDEQIDDSAEGDDSDFDDGNATSPTKKSGSATSRPVAKKKKVGAYSTLRRMVTAGLAREKVEQEVVISRSDDDNVAVAPPAVRPSSATNESSTPEMELQEGVVTDQRAKIAGEIRDTEEHFVFVMDLLEKHYHSSLQDLLKSGTAEVTKSSLDKIFANVEGVTTVNKELLKGVVSRLHEWGPDSRLGDIFIEAIPVLQKRYRAYGNGYCASVLELEECMRNPTFAAMVEKCDMSSGLKPRLPALLIAPIQRIPRYILLLEDMRRHTPEDHDDYEALGSAVLMMQQVADQLNNSVSKMENSRRMKDLIAKGAKIVREGRMLMHECLMYDENKRRKVHLFVFDDIFIHCNEVRPKTMTEGEKVWPLHLVWLKDNDQHRSECFELLGPSQTYKLKANSTNDKFAFIDALRKAIEKHLQVIAESNDKQWNGEKQAKMQEKDEKRFGHFEFHSSAVYTGWWKTGKMHGEGEWTYMGCNYTGNFVDGLMCGAGKMSYSNGDSYEGAWKDGRPNGKGTLTYSKGEKYSGNWLNGRKSGQGVMTYISSTYDGEWKNDVPCGLGELKYNDNEMYTGNWIDGRRTHYGLWVSSLGVRYEGSWSEGRFNGKGKLECPDGTVYEGMFVDGVREGQGKLESPSLGIYDGGWVNDLREGRGTMRFPNGDYYRGNWSRNSFHGSGKLRYKRGPVRSYKGEWINHKQQGKGMLVFSNRCIFEGHFKDNWVSGTGTFTFPNGDRVEGKWNKGQLEGKCSYITQSGTVITGLYQFGCIYLGSNKPAFPFHLPPIPMESIPLTQSSLYGEFCEKLVPKD